MAPTLSLAYGLRFFTASKFKPFVLVGGGVGVVKENFFGEIDDFAKFLSENPDLDVTIEGHTDSVGSRELNMKLSINRAHAVREAIIQRCKRAAS